MVRHHFPWQIFGKNSRYWQRWWRLGWLIALLVLLTAGSPLAAGAIANEEAQTKYPVILQGKTLFSIEEAVGSFTPEERAEAVTKRLKDFAKDTDLRIDILNTYANQKGGTVDIRVGETAIVTITDKDAKAMDSTPLELAEQYFKEIKPAVQKYRKSNRPRVIALGTLYTLLLSLFVIVTVQKINHSVASFRKLTSVWKGDDDVRLRFFKPDIIPVNWVLGIALEVVRLIRMALVLLIFSLYINSVLGFFPWTKGMSDKFFEYFSQAFFTLGDQFLAYSPKLFSVALIVVFTRYTLRFTQFVFNEIPRGTIELPGFAPEWAKPSHNIVRIAILALAGIMVFPYLPGAGTPAFKGVSIFLGVLVTLGSSGVVANFVAGIILTYIRAFKVGDRVRVSSSVGDVLEQTLFVTRINTPKNMVITIPNAMVLGCHIINYSGSISNEKTQPLTMYTTITLGYDVSWRLVHQILKEAASATEHILKEPVPYVLQTSLDDFYVSYELNAYTEKAKLMPQIYSEMHQHIQDKCNEAGVEILSPHYAAMRDANQLTVPPDYIPEGYEAPGFRLFSLGHKSSADHMPR